ncbi:LOG family protein [Lacticaseibacillus sp. GG6-2]
MTRIAVYCGANVGQPEYINAAKDLGKWLVANKYSLVYGGGGVGLMSVLAKTVLLLDGRVTGVMPQNLYERGASLPELEDLIVVPDMATRKQEMLRMADGCIALPGGPGTLEEIVEAYSWARIGDNDAPCAFYNVNGYWDPLAAMFDKMVESGFLTAEHRSKLLFASDLDEIGDFFASYTPPTIRKY